MEEKVRVRVKLRKERTVGKEGKGDREETRKGMIRVKRRQARG